MKIRVATYGGRTVAAILTLCHRNTGLQIRRQASFHASAGCRSCSGRPSGTRRRWAAQGSIWNGVMSVRGPGDIQRSVGRRAFRAPTGASPRHGCRTACSGGSLSIAPSGWLGRLPDGCRVLPADCFTNTAADVKPLRVALPAIRIPDAKVKELE